MTPPLIIVKGKVILAKWFADIHDDDYLIGVSESGYANNVLFFQWLQHWEAMSRRTQKGNYRLLLLDGYDSHLTYTALKFCEMQNKQTSSRTSSDHLQSHQVQEQW